MTETLSNTQLTLSFKEFAEASKETSKKIDALYRGILVLADALDELTEDVDGAHDKADRIGGALDEVADILDPPPGELAWGGPSLWQRLKFWKA